MVRIFDLIKLGKQKLNNSNTPQLDAEVILSYIMKTDRISFYIDRDKEVNDEIVAEFNKLIHRRSKGEPIAYITGVKEFMGMDFSVRPGVLIPRGDTEVLVEEVIKRIHDIKRPLIADIGCGSGAISVAVAKHKQDAMVYAVDIMDIPLQTTKENAIKNGVQDRITIIKSDILTGLEKSFRKNFDVIISNPPYIEEEIIPTLMEDVKEYEPITALTGGKDGLFFYREITEEATQFLKPGGLLAYEIGYNQGKEVIKILKSRGFNEVTCIKDLAGFDRVVLGYLYT